MQAPTLEIVDFCKACSKFNPQGLLGQISTICAGAGQYNCLLSFQRWPILETTIYSDVFA